MRCACCGTVFLCHAYLAVSEELPAADGFTVCGVCGIILVIDAGDDNCHVATRSELAPLSVFELAHLCAAQSDVLRLRYGIDDFKPNLGSLFFG
jgi:hypothetical protein